MDRGVGGCGPPHRSPLYFLEKMKYIDVIYMHENHKKMLLRRWENLGALYDFEVIRQGRDCFLAVFMNKTYNYRDQRQFELDRSPVEVIEAIEKIRNAL